MSKRLENNGQLRKRIAQSMGLRQDPDFMRFCKGLDSGYAYLGQFIAHEITSITDTYQASREVTGLMDLHSLYGNRQNYQLQHIGADDLLFSPDGCFKFSATTTIPTQIDFQRNAEGVAVIPERRNDDHVIIAQMHMLWQRFHNLLIKKGFAANALEAKKRVVLTFQLIVVEDYLRQVHDPLVYQQMIEKGQDFLADDVGDDSLWQEVFRFATFRFGHSTIRHSYSLRRDEDDFMAIKELNQLFMASRAPRQIEADDYIDWRVFFCLKGDDQFEGVMPVDTAISGFMTRMPKHKGDHIGTHIALRNIESELAAKLPCGFEIAKRVEQCLPDAIKEEFTLLNTRSIEDAAFNHLDLEIDDLTIWLYMLLEAQLTDVDHKLGMVGSCVNIHVIKQSIKQADFSIYQHGQYDFDTVLDKLGDWGEVLKGLSEQHDNEENGKIQMQDLVNYLINQEQGVSNA